jgi:hypothetical protein
MNARFAAGAAFVMIIGGVAPLTAPAGTGSAEAASQGVLPFDFDGDGYADMTVGIPSEDIGSRRDAGAVQVLYGSASGATARDQLWHQARRGVKGAAEAGDHFGSSLASGDFNADGYADLAVGIPGEGIGRRSDAGAVQVLYGGPRGLTASGDQVWHQGSRGVPGSNERNDAFGGALAVGHFDADGYADLAIGVSQEGLAGLREPGRVVILRGSASGLTGTGAQSWSQASAGIASGPGRFEEFGIGLAAGDVTNDGLDDLVVAVFREADARVGSGIDNVGSAVHLLRGSPPGLTASGSQYFRLADLGLNPISLVDDLALADVNADGHADLALAVNRRTTDDVALVLHGHSDGFHPAGLGKANKPGRDAFWVAPGTSAVAAGDLTGDGHADLVVGGRTRVIPGSSNGLGPASVEWPSAFIPDRFGFGPQDVGVLPLSGGSHEWLIAGPMGGDGRLEGAVAVLQGRISGKQGPVTTWSQDSPGIKGAGEGGDLFGAAVG